MITVETTRRGIERREVVEFYVRYDCTKKRRPTPTLESWSWSQADTLDRELKQVGLKFGVIPGYLLWDFVALSLDDLRGCAVQRGILPSQVLFVAEESGALARWRADRPSPWLEQARRGQAMEERAALILRPAVSSERPARWYAEDGSGRALGILSSGRAFGGVHPVAFAYVGRVLDRDSAFMREHFGELLPDHGAS